MMRKHICRLILPSIERNLVKNLHEEIKALDHAMSCMLAPRVHSYQAARINGAFGASFARRFPQRLVRVARPMKQENGLFYY